MNSELLKGSIDILLLSQLSAGDSYGFEILKKLLEKSGDYYKMSEGTLYPALQRLEQKMLLTSYWGEVSSGGRRKYYSLTEEGKKELSKKLEEWDRMSELVNSCKTEGLKWTNSTHTLKSF